MFMPVFQRPFSHELHKKQKSYIKPLVSTPLVFLLISDRRRSKSGFGFPDSFFAFHKCMIITEFSTRCPTFCDAEISAPNSSSLVVSSPIKGSILPLAENRDPFLETRAVPRSDASLPRSLFPRTGSRVWQELKEREEPS